jgi:hypothetical protein
MQRLLWDGVTVYLDDIIIIGGRNFQEYLKLLRDVLQRLREAGLTVKSSKVKLCSKQLTFLGHEVSGHGVKPDPDKIQAIKGWPTPTTSKEVRAFRGFCNYSDFIPNLQRRACVLSELNRQAKFVWKLERVAAFNDLKNALSSGNVLLQFPNMSKPFELSTDASDSGVGCVLSLRDKDG